MARRSDSDVVGFVLELDRGLTHGLSLQQGVQSFYVDLFVERAREVDSFGVLGACEGE